MYKLLDDYYYGLDCKLNVTDLAKNCGVSRQQMHKYLDCSVLPRVDVAIKMSQYLSDLWDMPVYITSLWNL